MRRKLVYSIANHNGPFSDAMSFFPSREKAEEGKKKLIEAGVISADDEWQIVSRFIFTQ